MGGFKNTLTTINSGRSNLYSRARRNAGFSKGYYQAKEIYANLKDGETIKIATHSMGSAYGKGFVNGLKRYAKEEGIDHRIERVLDLAAYQGKSLTADPNILNEQIAHTSDGVAGVSRIQGIDDNNFHETRQDVKTKWYDKTSEHSVDSFSQKEIDTYVREGNSSTAQPKPSNGRIIVDYEQNAK